MDAHLGAQRLDELGGRTCTDVREQQRLLELVPVVLAEVVTREHGEEPCPERGAGAGEPVAEAHETSRCRLGDVGLRLGGLRLWRSDVARGREHRLAQGVAVDEDVSGARGGTVETARLVVGLRPLATVGGGHADEPERPEDEDGQSYPDRKLIIHACSLSGGGGLPHHESDCRSPQRRRCRALLICVASR